MEKLKILLIGTGLMAAEHAKVLRSLGLGFSVAARNPETLAKFSNEYSADSWFRFDDLTLDALRGFQGAVIASAVEALEPLTRRLIEAGVPRILVEKPATLDSKASYKLHEVALGAKCDVRVAYNRRYYAPVLHLKHLLKESPALAGFFDFTEWPHHVLAAPMADITKARLAIANSGHVIDTVEFLLGDLQDLTVAVKDPGTLDWHPDSATFVGMGKCAGAPVSYCTSWLSAGRWNIEVLTLRGRYKLSPMEKLQLLPHRTIHWEDVPLQAGPETEFKPGLYAMLKAFFLEPLNECHLPNLKQNAGLLERIEKIAGYGETR